MYVYAKVTPEGRKMTDFHTGEYSMYMYLLLLAAGCAGVLMYVETGLDAYTTGYFLGLALGSWVGWRAGRGRRILLPGEGFHPPTGGRSQRHRV